MSRLSRQFASNDLAAVDPRAASAENHRKYPIYRRYRGHRSAVAKRRLTGPSPKITHSPAVRVARTEARPRSGGIGHGPKSCPWLPRGPGRCRETALKFMARPPDRRASFGSNYSSSFKRNSAFAKSPCPLSMAAIFDSAEMLEHGSWTRFSFVCRDWYDFDSVLRIGTSFPPGWSKGRKRADMPAKASLTAARTRRRI